MISSYRQASRAPPKTSYVLNNYKVASSHIPLRHMYVVVSCEGQRSNTASSDAAGETRVSFSSLEQGWTRFLNLFIISNNVNVV